jgi:hypothetical protein
MDDRVRTAVWAIAGLVFVVVLSWAAFAVAGGRISEPAGSVRVPPAGEDGQSEPRMTPSVTPSPDHSPKTASPQPTATRTSDAPSPSDDHGGSSSGDSSDSSGSGSDDGTSHDADDD